MIHCLSLEISPYPNHQAHCLRKNGPEQPENSFYFDVFGNLGAIQAPSNEPNEMQKGPQEGRIYGLVFKHKNEPLTKSLGPFF
jgi:hypothetical protein